MTPEQMNELIRYVKGIYSVLIVLTTSIFIYVGTHLFH